jgi:hypothetical protein
VFGILTSSVNPTAAASELRGLKRVAGTCPLISRFDSEETLIKGTETRVEFPRNLRPRRAKVLWDVGEAFVPTKGLRRVHKTIAWVI